MGITKESEIAEEVPKFFTEWNMYPEVPIGQGKGIGSIDWIGVKGSVVMAVEAKMNLNFDVLQQAYRNRAYAHFSYICVPNRKNVPEFFARVCKDYGIGVLFIEKETRILREALKPKFNRKIKRLPLKAWMLDSVSGSKDQRTTAYSYALSQIILNLRRSGGRLNIANAFAKTTYHWSSVSSAKQCILTYIRKGIIKEFKHEGGYLILNKSNNTNNESQSQT